MHEGRLADWMRWGSLNRGTSDRGAEEEVLEPAATATAEEDEDEEEDEAEGAGDPAAAAAEEAAAPPALTNFIGVCIERCCFGAASRSPERVGAS